MTASLFFFLFALWLQQSETLNGTTKEAAIFIDMCSAALVGIVYRRRVRDTNQPQRTRGPGLSSGGLRRPPMQGRINHFRIS
jgi:hypothetical protein